MSGQTTESGGAGTRPFAPVETSGDLDHLAERAAEELDRNARPAPVAALDETQCSIVECACKAIEEIDVSELVVEMTAPSEPVRLCADHAFDRLAAMSRSQLGV